MTMNVNFGLWKDRERERHAFQGEFLLEKMFLNPREMDRILWEND